MSVRFALYMQDKHSMPYELEMAQYAEERGFSEIWQADTRLARDCVVMMSAFLTHTKRLRIGSGVLPIWTRNPAIIAATWSSMWELGGQVAGHGRVMLGLGAWWEPISSRVGVNRRKPLQAMREYVESIRQLFTMEEVTYQGEFVHLDRVRLDVAFGDTSPRDIPIYIGATGPKMLELTGEICDGVVLNYVVSVDYIRKAVKLVEKGAKKAGKTLADVDRPELLVCCLSDEDPAAAMAEGKKLVAYYLATEPHIMKASGVSDELLEKVQAIMSWPATEEDYIRASAVIPDEVVRNVMAVGTTQECQDKVAEYIDAGVTCPILYPMMDDIKPVVDAFADWGEGR
ncbi:MAG: LLM class flavin-dependent oxidoreductase [Chloroflexi bacterium]|nr:LLM class flavin-dependent oxidoreductase [Chloroflexota bacterium]